MARKAVDMEALRRHIRARGAEYLRDPNITSVGIGRKNGNGELCIQFTVASKGESAIETIPSRRIPESIEVAGRTVPTDVIERDYAPSFKLVRPEQMDERRIRVDPLRPGVSVSHVAGTAGTLGLIVYDRVTGAPCILSNWHVLQGPEGIVGDTVVQPGPFDDNNIARNAAGTLIRSHLGPAGDCALARIRGRDHDGTVEGLDVVPTRMAEVELGDTVVKSGRTTGITHGIVQRIDVMVKLDYDVPEGPQAIGGFEIGPDPDHPAPDGEISMGGDSGSAWLIADGGTAMDIFAGLHFAGNVGGEEHALACYPLSVQKKLDFVLTPPAMDPIPETELKREGYDAGFLGLPVPEPVLSLAQKRDAVNFGKAQVIPYTHFSVCLSAARRLARFVAWNIDGARIVKVKRTGFAFDPRIDQKHQSGDDIYAGNRLDRGHIARRADLCWGDVAEARQANRDSFYFTNIAPQHERYNQSSRKGLWGELENLVFDQADVMDLKLSVMGGPIFGESDPVYRGLPIPTAFWKLIAWRDEGGLRCSAFLLSQSDLLSDIETLDLDPFRIYQIGVADLAARTALGFPTLLRADTMRSGSESEGSPTMVELRSAADLRL